MINNIGLQVGVAMEGRVAVDQVSLDALSEILADALFDIAGLMLAKEVPEELERIRDWSVVGEKIRLPNSRPSPREAQ